MSVRQRGLGRGLNALIAPAAHPVARSEESGGDDGPGPGADGVAAASHADAGTRITAESGTGAAGASVVGEFRLVPIDMVSPNPRQPRAEFDEESLEQLAASIREVGVLQPVVVRSLDAGRYELVMGERRWRAARLAGCTELPAIIRHTSDDDLLRDALLENIHREQLNPLEEAAAYQQLLGDFGCTHESLAGSLGRSRSHVTNTIRLLGLPPAVQRRVAAGVLSAGHARALLGMADPEAMAELATRIVAEGLSVRAVEELVSLRQPTKPARRPPRPRPPHLDDVATRLADRLETRVKVEMGRGKGRITVEFGSLEDLERIAAAMAPPPPAWA